jgi:Mannosyl-glycoprotein endo-beta-N-acetylglucosaminidase/LysM domain
MKKLFVFLVTGITALNAAAQKFLPEDYISMYKDAAIIEMKRSGVPASITLAQGILETESGNSELVLKSNNHFGIKCKKDWTGESVTHTDDAPNECFRKYASALESYQDHSDYLRNSPRYASLFELDKTDYKGWAFGLKRAGYATNPRYPQILISNIEKYNLLQYDTAAVPENMAAVIGSPLTDSARALLARAKPLPVSSNLKSAIEEKRKFNGLRAVFVSKGTSLLAIASAAEIDLPKLMEFNDLQTEGLLPSDQIVYLEKKNKQAKFKDYTTEYDEPLYDISQSLGVQIKQLQSLNNLPANSVVKKGTTIKLQ